MIKFFRKVRHRLLKENRFSRYMLYAIGEIFLVVVGILIALQINNRNEATKERAVVDASLAALKLNLSEDIENLKDQISYDKAILKAVDFTFRLISSEDYKNVPLSEFRDSIFDVATERTFFSSNTAFRSMESGSHFQWIDSPKLTESIYKYYALLERFSNITGENNQFVKTHMEGFTYNQMEFGTLLPGINPYSDQKKLDVNNMHKIRGSTIFENALIGRKFRASGEINQAEDAITRAVELIKKIDNYRK